MRARRLHWLAAALLAAGCGTRFELPTEARLDRGFPADGSYQRLANWNGMDGVSDILLTQGRGTQLFIAFKAPQPGLGRVVEYALTNPAPVGFEIDSLIQPHALAFWNNRLFVLDQGDTAAARITIHPDSTATVYRAGCGSLRNFRRPIADLSRYWRVREYDLTGDTLSTFTDTTFAHVNGIAADAQGRIYVSGVAMHCDVDPFDSRIVTLEFEYRIRRYVRGGPHPDMPGASWQRDPGFDIQQGTGIGSTQDPGQMTWDGWDGGALFFCDRGNDEVQKLADAGGGATSFKVDEGDSLLLDRPLDVATDRAGFFYVVDSGNRRVLRYDAQGEYVQRVDFDLAIPAPPLQAPAAVAADDSLVYVADPGAGLVIRYKRRS